MPSQTLENATLVQTPCFHKQENEVPQNGLRPKKRFHQEVRGDMVHAQDSFFLTPGAEYGAWHALSVQ